MTSTEKQQITAKVCSPYLDKEGGLILKFKILALNINILTHQNADSKI